METKVVTAHLPLDLVERVDRFAESLERPKAWIIKQALVDWVEREELKDRLTCAVLAEIDQGLVVDHEVMKRWADSLGTSQPLPAPEL